MGVVQFGGLQGSVDGGAGHPEGAHEFGDGLPVVAERADRPGLIGIQLVDALPQGAQQHPGGGEVSMVRMTADRERARRSRAISRARSCATPASTRTGTPCRRSRRAACGRTRPYLRGPAAGRGTPAAHR